MEETRPMPKPICFGQVEVAAEPIGPIIRATGFFDQVAIAEAYHCWAICEHCGVLKQWLACCESGSDDLEKIKRWGKLCFEPHDDQSEDC